MASYRPAESVTDTRELLAMPTRKFSRFDDEQEGREQVDEVQLTTGSEAPRSSEADDTFDEVAEQPIDEAAGQPEPEQPASRRKSRCCCCGCRCCLITILLLVALYGWMWAESDGFDTWWPNWFIQYAFLDWGWGGILYEPFSKYGKQHHKFAVSVAAAPVSRARSHAGTRKMSHRRLTVRTLCPTGPALQRDA